MGLHCDELVLVVNDKLIVTKKNHVCSVCMFVTFSSLDINQVRLPIQPVLS